MTEFAKAKEKAEELILKFMRLQERNYNWFDSKLGKQCALIAVDEIINAIGFSNNVNVDYWLEVKKEIEKMMTEEAETLPSVHKCKYSKAMNQEYPRKCINCGKPEGNVC